MRRLFDRVVIKQALRADNAVMEAADVRAALADPDMGAARERAVGFV